MNEFFKAFAVKGGCLIILAFFLGSCWPEPLVVKGIPAVKPEIVVATQLIPKQAMVVWFTSTFGILEANENSDPEEVLKKIAVNDAVVTITGPSGTDTLMYIESGVYGGLMPPLEEEQTYNLLVKSESLGEISAATIVKPKVDFETIEAGLHYTIYDDTLTQIKYSFADPQEKNWYMVNVQKVGAEVLGNIQDAINPETFTFLLDDADFNGQVYKGQLEFKKTGVLPGDSVVVSLSNISGDYYKFLEMRKTSQEGVIEFLSEPMNYPTNVAGGKGYFNLHVPDIRFMVLEEEK